MKAFLLIAASFAFVYTNQTNEQSPVWQKILKPTEKPSAKSPVGQAPACLPGRGDCVSRVAITLLPQKTPKDKPGFSKKSPACAA